MTFLISAQFVNTTTVKTKKGSVGGPLLLRDMMGPGPLSPALGGYDLKNF